MPHAMPSESSKESHDHEKEEGERIALWSGEDNPPEEEELEDVPDVPISHDHCLTHLPKSKNCPVCVQAKLYETPHIKKE